MRRAVVLSQSDAEQLRRQSDYIKKFDVDDPAVPSYQPYDERSPDVYLVRTPPGGIPAMVNLGAGSGTETFEDVGTGTGTSHDDVWLPGVASCEVYKTLEDYPTYYVNDTGFFEDVLNVSLVAVPGNAWRIIARDKFGEWYVLADSGGSGGGNGSTIPEPPACGLYQCQVRRDWIHSHPGLRPPLPTAGYQQTSFPTPQEDTGGSRLTSTRARYTAY